MAFIEKSGKGYSVRQGNTGRRLSHKSTREKAVKEVKRLHAKNKPRSSNKGASAKKKQGKMSRKRR